MKTQDDPAGAPHSGTGGARNGPAPVMARCIDHVNLSVRDLDASVDFYCRLLGVVRKEGGEDNGVRWCILGAKDKFYVCFFEVKGGVYRPADVHVNHVGFVVDDMDETVRRIHDLGFKLQFNDEPVQWPRSRSAYVADPDGILIEFTERFGGGLD
jgi:catechol 2,3-dioxygenase-like lactoylglutathione lyase family enzyme